MVLIMISFHPFVFFNEEQDTVNKAFMQNGVKRGCPSALFADERARFTQLGTL